MKLVHVDDSKRCIAESDLEAPLSRLRHKSNLSTISNTSVSEKISMAYHLFLPNVNFQYKLEDRKGLRIESRSRKYCNSGMIDTSQITQSKGRGTIYRTISYFPFLKLCERMATAETNTASKSFCDLKK